jgi:hypothetical protein
MKFKVTGGLIIFSLVACSAVSGVSHIGTLKFGADFRFEDYPSAEKTQKRLDELFPKGSNSSELQKFLQQHKASCSDYRKPLFGCVYTVHTTERQWGTWVQTRSGKVESLKAEYYDQKQAKQLQPDAPGEFQFENYETAESGKARLLKLFPVGSRVEQLISLMKSKGLEGNESNDAGKRGIYFIYYQPLSFGVSINWDVYAYIDSKNRIVSLEVYRGLSQL